MPFRPSGPSINSPLVEPVAIPMFARGHFDHHARIFTGSVVALFAPMPERGCLPGLPEQGFFAQEHLPLSIHSRGSTAHPRSAYPSAASSRGFSGTLSMPFLEGI